MIRMTERAAVALNALLSSNRTPSDQGVKLVPTDSGGLGLTIEKPKEGDDVVDVGSRPLLIVDSSLTDKLQAAVLDVDREEKDGEVTKAHFVVRGSDA